MKLSIIDTLKDLEDFIIKEKIDDISDNFLVETDPIIKILSITNIKTMHKYTLVKIVTSCLVNNLDIEIKDSNILIRGE